MRHPAAIKAMTVFQTSPRVSTVTDTKGEEMDPQTTQVKQVSVSWTWEMPWQSDGCPLTGKQGVEEEEEEEGDTCLTSVCPLVRELVKLWR